METQNNTFKFKNEAKVTLSIRPLYGCLGKAEIVLFDNFNGLKEVKSERYDLTKAKSYTLDTSLVNNSVINIIGLLNPLPGKKEFGVKVESVLNSTLVFSEAFENSEDVSVFLFFEKES